MKKVLLGLALAMSLPTMAMAFPGDQGGPRQGGGPGEMIRQAQQELGLSQDQTKTLRDATQEEMRAHFEITMRYLDKLSDADKAAMKKEHEEASKKRQTKVMGMLTPEQQTKAANAFLKHKAELDKQKGADQSR